MAEKKAPPPLDPGLVQRFAGLMQARAGLKFGGHNLSDLEEGINITAGELGFTDANRFYQTVTLATDEARFFFEKLIRAVTIGETYLFRYPEQFTVLRENVLPDIIARKRQQGDLSLRLWSAGCSTGEEAYSLAILLQEVLVDFHRWQVSILATDINRESLDRARMAEYGRWSFRGVDDALRDRYFQVAGDDQRRCFLLTPEIRRMVSFRYLNLKDDCYPALITSTTAMDLIFCRNVLIYFSDDVNREVIGRLHSSLVHDGYLMVGPAEPNDSLFGKFKSHFLKGTMIYQRAEDGVAGAPGSFEPRKAPAGEPAQHRSAPSPLRPEATGNEPRPLLRRPSLAPDNVTGHIQLGYRAWREGHLERARDHFVKASELDSTHSEPYFMLALIAADRGQNHEALRLIGEAAQRSGTDPRIYHLASIIASEQGDTESAVRHLRRAIFLDRNFVLGHFSLAVALKKLGHVTESIRHLRNALALLENLPDDHIIPGVEEIAVGWLKKVSHKHLAELTKT